MFASASNPGFIQPPRQQRRLLWCVLASIALHALALLGLSPYEAPAPPAKTLQVLTATLAQVATTSREPPPQKQPVPEVPAAPPTPPKPAPKPSPVVSRPAVTPAPAVEKPTPVESEKPPPDSAAVSPAPAAPSAKPAVAAPPKSAPESPIGATNEATARSGSDADTGTKERYRLALIVATRRYKRYPAIAMEKGWQGKVEVRLEIGANGMLASASIKTSSGHEILDDQAIDMLKKGKTTVQIPPGLRGREFSVDVPVIFNLDNPNS